MNVSTGVVHIVEPGKAVAIGKRVRNGRSKSNVHLTNTEIPKHSGYTVCGIQMKGSRWEVTGSFPTCQNCLKGVTND